MKEKIFAVVVILLWVVSRGVKAYSAGDTDLQELTKSNAAYSDEASWYTNGEVEFAINIFDDEWKELYTQEEMIAACQIPDKLLKELTTYELLKLTEEYPLLGNIYTNNSMEEGFQYIVDSFNGLKELLSREDCLEVVYEEYNNLTIPEKKMIDYGKYETEEEQVAYFNEILHDDDMLKIALEDAEPLIVCDLLEMMMLSKTTEDNIELLLGAVTDKAPEKEKAECFGFANKSPYISGLEESMLSDISAYVTTDSEGTTPDTLYWKGIAIDVLLVNVPRNNTYDQALRIIEPYRDQGVTLVGLGTNQYNCHSYAWLKEIFPNSYHFFLLNTVPDGLMKECIKYKEPRNGAIAYKAQHSAVVVDATHRNEIYQYDPIVIAKWAGGPIVRGPMSVGDYGMSHEEVYGYYCYRTSTK